MLARMTWIGFAALILIPFPAFAQNSPPASGASALPSPRVSGTHRMREHHRQTLVRQRARATSNHAQQIRAK
jgi:hypothetical protein